MDKPQIVRKVRTLPGAAAAVLATAAVGAAVAYFAPGFFDDVTGQNDLHMSVQSNPATIDTFSDLPQGVIVPDGAESDTGPGGGCQGFSSWASSVGGVSAGRSQMRIIAQAGADQVVVSGIRAKIVDRQQPLEGTGFECPTAGEASVRGIAINLDDPNPLGRVVKDGKPSGTVAFTVGKDDSEVFDITATTTECDCTWVLEFVTTQGGVDKVVTVPDDGSMFETTAWGADPLTAPEWGATAPFYEWDFGDHWIEIHPSPSGDRNVSRQYSVQAGLPPELPTVTH